MKPPGRVMGPARWVPASQRLAPLRNPVRPDHETGGEEEQGQCDADIRRAAAWQAAGEHEADVGLGEVGETCARREGRGYEQRLPCTGRDRAEECGTREDGEAPEVPA